MRKGQRALPVDQRTAEEEIKDPMALEVLRLKDEFSGCAIEDALIHRLVEFLLDLRNDFALIGRQKLPRVGAEWDRTI